MLNLLASQAAISFENARLYADLANAKADIRASERELRQAIDLIPALAWNTQADGSKETFNKPWHDYTGISPENARAGGWIASYHPDDAGRIVKRWKELLAVGLEGEEVARLRRFDGEYRSFLIRGKPLRDESGAITKWYGTCTDIEELKRAETLLAGEKRLFEMITTGNSLPETLNALCVVVEELVEGSIASILLLDEDGKRLWHGAAPSLPASYIEAIDGALFDPRAGSCGTAAYLREKAFVADIATDPLWTDYAELALKHGLRACFSIPILSSEAKVLGTLAIYSDQARPITPLEDRIGDRFTHLASILIERKRAENALAKSEALLVEGQRISQTGSWIWNVSTGKIVWSEEHCRIFGFRIDQLNVALESFLQTIYPADLARVQTVLDDAVRRSCEFSVEYRINLSDGSLKHIHSRGRPVVGELGQVEEFVGTAMDISYRYEAKLALENALAKAVASGDQLRTLIDTMPGLAWTAGPNGEAEFLSQGWLDYTGMTKEEAQGPGWANAIHPDDVGLMVERWQKIIASKKAGEQEARLRRFDGVYRWFSFRGAPLLDRWGHVVKWYGVNIDIDDQKQAEIELRRREAALRKVETDLAHLTRVTTMGELTASIAHEVNQPLTGIVMGGNAALRWLERDSPNLDEARESIRSVIQEGKRAGHVIARIRKLFKKDDPIKEPLNINDIIQEVVVLTRNELKRHNIAQQLHLAADLPPALGDRVQIQQVLMNLILNAIDGMNAVVASSRELSITTLKTDEDKVCVEVRDSGVGINPQDTERIFETFHTTKPGGMGMGLAICRSIVQNHGGRLHVVPQEGPGATFRFTLATRG